MYSNSPIQTKAIYFQDVPYIKQISYMTLCSFVIIYSWNGTKPIRIHGTGIYTYTFTIKHQRNSCEQIYRSENRGSVMGSMNQFASTLMVHGTPSSSSEYVGVLLGNGARRLPTIPLWRPAIWSSSDGPGVKKTKQKYPQDTYTNIYRLYMVSMLNML